MAEAPESSATARRMLVGARLRRLREAKGISRQEAGFAIRASESKLSRMEAGRVGFKERDIADLLVLYGVVDPDERARILELVRAANRPGWWREYDDVMPDWFDSYVGLESAASQIRSYEIQFVPGLLQTADYARAMIASALPEPSPEVVDRGVDLRMNRQQILGRSGASRLWAVIDEGALRRPVGKRRTHRGQLEHLVEVAGRPGVTVQILPFRSGSHAVAGGAFCILRFADPDLPDIAYLEQLLSAMYIDRPDQVDRYTELMDRLCVESLTPKDTIAHLRRLVQEI